jgi:DNA-binding LacI/PurR family transcriptional regulator
MAVRHARLSPDHFQLLSQETMRDFYAYDDSALEQKIQMYQALLTDGPLALQMHRHRGDCALILPTDHEAPVLLPLLKSRGWEVGRDIGVIGFDGAHLSRQWHVSSMRPPLEALGETTGRALMSAVRNGVALAQQTRLLSQLIARTSTDRQSDKLAVRQVEAPHVEASVA